MRRLVSLLLLGVLGAATLAAQALVPSFRSTVNAVLVDFTVADERGRFAPDLTADEITVEEDGRPQAISAFSLVNVPTEEATHVNGAFVDRSVASNIDGEGRLFVLVIDDVRLHPLRLTTAKAIAWQFLERHLGPRDLVAFIALSGTSGLGYFTGDRTALSAQIGNIRSHYDDFYSLAPSIRTLRYLENIVNRLAAIEGRRKSLILVSEGIFADVKFARPNFAVRLGASDAADDEVVEEPPVPPQPGFDFTGTRSSDATAMLALIEAAARANVAFYPIDPRGQPGGPWTSIRPGRLGPREDPLWDNRAFEQDVMAALASETGGSRLYDSNDFTGALNRIVQDAGSHYLLAYVPSRTKPEGRRDIRVATKRSDLRVHARRGYMDRPDVPVERGKLRFAWTPGLFALMDSPVQTSGLGLRIGAAVFRAPTGSTGTVALSIHVRGGDLRVDPLAELDLAAVAFDSRGNMAREWHSSPAQGLRQLSPEAVVRDGVRLVTGLDLKPGRYVVRVAAVARSGSTNRRGSVQLDIDVPDLSRGSLTMSGVVVTSRDEDQRPSIRVESTHAPNVSPTVTARRDFATGDELTAFARFYVNDRRITKVDVTAAVQAEDGSVVFANHASLLRDKASKRSDLAYASTIPLRDLHPGGYLLTIEATANRPNTPAKQHVAFVVH